MLFRAHPRSEISKFINAYKSAGSRLIKKEYPFLCEVDSLALANEQLDFGNCYLAFTADHSTPCEAYDHTGDGVPTFIAGNDVRRDKVDKVGECYFMEGALNNLTANDIFRLQMDLMGFEKKVGS